MGDGEAGTMDMGDLAILFILPLVFMLIGLIIFFVAFGHRNAKRDED